MILPMLKKPVPAQSVQELLTLLFLDLKDYLEIDKNSYFLFSAKLNNGLTLPKGLVCTKNGILIGIPIKGTRGQYEIVIRVTNKAGSIQFPIYVTITEKLELLANEFNSQTRYQTDSTPRLFTINGKVI